MVRIREGDGERVVQHGPSLVEVDPMLAAVGGRLPGVPLENHCGSLHATYLLSAEHVDDLRAATKYATSSLRRADELASMPVGYIRLFGGPFYEAGFGGAFALARV
jgi:hypothetical protein